MATEWVPTHSGFAFRSEHLISERQQMKSDLRADTVSRQKLYHDLQNGAPS